MKKFFISFTASLALLSSLAMAKTEGNSVQLNLINTTAEFSSEDVSFDGNDIGIGVAYKNTIALENDIYIAPGAFYDFNNTEVSNVRTFRTQRFNTIFDVKYSYGFGADLGYNINNQISVFANLSWLEARGSGSFATNGVVSTSSSGSDEGISYGLGVEYAIDKQISAVLSYNATELSDFIDIETIKLGVAYNF